MNDSEQRQKGRRQVADYYSRHVPHNAALGAEVIDVGPAWGLSRLAYRPQFLGDAENGLWHTGVAASLADAACGLAVMLAFDTVESIATLDLRMDYLRPAVADKPLHARAECYHLTRYIAFARSLLYQDDEDRPTAKCTASFMLTSRGRGA